MSFEEDRHGKLANPISIYKILRKYFGFLNWWPGETSFEVLIGAILTQQTSWKNVEKSIESLKKAHVLELKNIAKINVHTLEKLIKQSGFYKQKARRLKKICSYILNTYGSLEVFFKLETMELRKELMSLKGIGKETADSIILYAANKTIFVVDAYTRRIMSRLTNGKVKNNIKYDILQKYFESKISRDLNLYKDFHAQFVEVGKNYCRVKPICNECPLRAICDYANNKIG